MQGSDRTVTLAFRYSSKSVTFYTFLMWLMFRADSFGIPFVDLMYLSYKHGNAQKHVQKTKRYIQACSLFKGYTDLTDAEAMIKYKTPGGITFEVRPEGALGSLRGQHPFGILVDDPLLDPTERLDLTQINKITRIVQDVILPMPKLGGCLHFIGTAQDYTDLFFVLKEESRGFDWQMYPAIKQDGSAEWPELYGLDKLERMRLSQGDPSFEKEFLLRPARSTDSFLNAEKVRSLVDPNLVNNRVTEEIEDVCYAGLDIGKKRHPSHLAVFKRAGDDLVQVHSKWFDGVDYTVQVDYCKQAVENFNIRKLIFDNTRAEFDAFQEAKELPRVMEGVAMTGKQKWAAAEELSKVITQGRIRFLNDDRQIRLMLIVDNALQAPETPDGHGDSFVSVSLAALAARQGIREPRIRSL